MIAFFIDLALVHIGDDFSPLCAYGFNVNSRSVLVFVKDGLLSKSFLRLLSYVGKEKDKASFY